MAILDLRYCYRLALLGVILFGEETYYDHRIPQNTQSALQSRWLGLLGIEQWHSRRRRNTFKEAILRALIILTKPIILLTNLYYICIFAGLVAFNATLPIFLTTLYGFGPKEIGSHCPFEVTELAKTFRLTDF